MIFSKIFFVRIFPDSLVFSQQSKEVFELELNNLFGVFARVENQRKDFWEKILIELLYLCFSFSQGFFFVISDFHSFGFLHT